MNSNSAGVLLNDEELSEQPLKKQAENTLQPIEETQITKTKSKSNKIKTRKSQRKSKLQQSLSDRGLTFAIRHAI